MAFQKGHKGFRTRESYLKQGEKISKSKMGHLVSEGTREKLRKVNLGRKHTEETKKKIGLFFKGKKLSDKHKKKISASRKGMKFSEEHRKNISRTHQGLKPWLKGRKLSEEHIRHLSESHKGKVLEKASNWQGGISFEPYSVDWTQTLRQSIRERDKFICQLCNEIEKDRKHQIHHIDYNKKNCSLNNLINLCGSCHQKTNFHRDYWKQLLTLIIKNKIYV